jgi:hypothetical protein
MELDKIAVETKETDRPNPAPQRSGWEAWRAPAKPEDRTLSLEAVAWLDALSPDVRPHHLSERFPRICNRLAERWKHADLLVPYFDDLLMDNRGGRQGFPLSIAIEIVTLKEYFLQTRGANSGGWAQIAPKRGF